MSDLIVKVEEAKVVIRRSLRERFHKEKIGLFPIAVIYLIEVTKGMSSWIETLQTEVEKRAFIRGVEACASMFKEFNIKVENSDAEYSLLPYSPK